jgi:hypothetical protein
MFPTPTHQPCKKQKPTSTPNKCEKYSRPMCKLSIFMDRHPIPRTCVPTIFCLEGVKGQPNDVIGVRGDNVPGALNSVGIVSGVEGGGENPLTGVESLRTASWHRNKTICLKLIGLGKDPVSESVFLLTMSECHSHLASGYPHPRIYVHKTLFSDPDPEFFKFVCNMCGTHKKKIVREQKTLKGMANKHFEL